MPTIKDLRFLIGHWQTNGEVYEKEGSVESEFTGTDRYEWVAGEKMILHTIDVHMGNDHVQQIEVIRFDEREKRYTLHAFDGDGHSSLMHGVLRAAGNMISTDGYKRAILYVNDDNSRLMDAQWERSADGMNWITWMKLTLKKV